MSAERYKISECELDVLAITGPEGTYYIDGENIEARAIRQQARDIEQLRAELNRERETNAVLRRDLADPPPDIQELALKKCGHFEIVAKLRADLAAAVAERDEARTAYQVRSAEWHQYELIALALAERYKLRAEQAEARLAAIDGAPTVAVVCSSECFGAFVQQRLFGSELPNIGTELIARPAKD